MGVSKFWKTSGLAALAVALVVPPITAQAAESGQWRNRGERMAQQRDGARADSQRAARVDPRSEARPGQIERSGARAPRQAPQGDYPRAARIDRQSERTARQAERQSEQRAAQVAQGRTWQDRNRTNDGRGRDGTGRDWNGRGGDTGGRDWNDRNRDNNGRDWNDRNRNNNGRDNDRWRGNNDPRRNDNWRGNNDWRGNYNRDRDARRDYRQDQRRWDRLWRNDNRYNWHGYRQSNRRLYSPGRYYSPYRNYSYNRLSIGIRLDSLFFGSRYWINDPWQYRLPATYGPYRWVRYYDDVLLVDTYTGEVLDVIYDFFW